MPEILEAPAIFIPKYATSLKNTEDQIRLGLQGYGGTGKTWAALTFPNPVVVNFDRGLKAHSGREDVIPINLYDYEVCRAINPNHRSPSQVKDTVLLFLANDAKKFTREQTLVWDGGSGTQYYYHRWYQENKVYSKQTGLEDQYAQWKFKINFFEDICEMFKTLTCNVIYITHESDKKDKSGEYTGKVRPLLTGQFGDQIVKEFSDWFRQLSKAKPTDFSQVQKDTLDLWGVTKPEELKEMCDQFPRRTIYYWQTESDDVFDAKCGSLINFPHFMPANYETFCKYMRK